MLKNTLPIRIEWGDCDPATITFYPNSFRWFDQGTWRLFEVAGFYPGDLIRERGVHIPLVEAGAKFRRPGHMGDDRVTAQNLMVVRVDTANNILVVKGAVPGHNNSYCIIRKAKKKKAK